jgi:hypothetical protein
MRPPGYFALDDEDIELERMFARVTRRENNNNGA